MKKFVFTLVCCVSLITIQTKASDANNGNINIGFASQTLISTTSSFLSCISVLIPTRLKSYSFFDAIMLGNISEVKSLLSLNPKLTKVRYANDWTALHHASYYGLKDIVQLLLEKKANPNIKNKYGSTALHIAANQGHIDIVELLLENGAHPNIQNKNGWTAINLASEKGHKDIVQILIANQGDPYIQNELKWTALDTANREGHKDIADIIQNARSYRGVH